MKENLRILAAQFTATTNKCCVVLNSVGNPDKRQDHTKSLPGVSTQFKTVETYKEASDAVQKYNDDNDIGAGNYDGGEIISPAGEILAIVSYNGRVWDGPYGYGATPTEITDLNKSIL